MDQALSELSRLQQIILVCPIRDGCSVFVNTLSRVKDQVLLMTATEYQALVAELRGGSVRDGCPIVPPLWVEESKDDLR